MARGNDFYENYFSHGIDPVRRRLWLYDDIEEESISRFIMALVVMNDQNTSKPIDIFMSSCGGDEYEMLAAYDAIRSLSVTVRAFAMGKICSAAPLILAAADERYCFRNTQFMVHESSWDLEGRHNEMITTVEHYKELERRWAKCMAERTKLNATAWKRMTGKKVDSWFDAQKAVEYGLVHKILRAMPAVHNDNQITPEQEELDE